MVACPRPSVAKPVGTSRGVAGSRGGRGPFMSILGNARVQELVTIRCVHNDKLGENNCHLYQARFSSRRLLSTSKKVWFQSLYFLRHIICGLKHFPSFFLSFLMKIQNSHTKYYILLFAKKLNYPRLSLIHFHGSVPLAASLSQLLLKEQVLPM